MAWAIALELMGSMGPGEWGRSLLALEVAWR